VAWPLYFEVMDQNTLARDLMDLEGESGSGLMVEAFEPADFLEFLRLIFSYTSIASSKWVVLDDFLDGSAWSLT
jgi:hypothetical protein